MSTLVLLAVTGLGLGALYFLVASGLSLIFGLMGVLNFAHGAFLAVGAYARLGVGQHLDRSAPTCSSLCRCWSVRRPARWSPSPSSWCSSGRSTGAQIEQVLVTVGLALWLVALLRGIWGADPEARSPPPGWVRATTEHRRRADPQRPVPGDRRRRRWCSSGCWRSCAGPGTGWSSGPGVENRAMVTALGIDVRRAFTLVFAIGGAAAALAGALAGVYFGSVEPGAGHLAADLRVHRRGHRRARAR